MEGRTEGLELELTIREAARARSDPNSLPTTTPVGGAHTGREKKGSGALQGINGRGKEEYEV